MRIGCVTNDRERWFERVWKLIVWICVLFKESLAWMFRKTIHVNSGLQMRNPFRRDFYKPMNGKAEKFANFLDEIIRANEDSPTIVVDIDDIVQKFKVWEVKMVNIHPYYFVGCNRDPVIIKLVSILCKNFSCSTIVSDSDPKLSSSLLLLDSCFNRVKFIRSSTKITDRPLSWPIPAKPTASFIMHSREMLNIWCSIQKLNYKRLNTTTPRLVSWFASELVIATPPKEWSKSME